MEVESLEVPFVHTKSDISIFDLYVVDYKGVNWIPCHRSYFLHLQSLLSLFKTCIVCSIFEALILCLFVVFSHLFEGFEIFFPILSHIY